MPGRRDGSGSRSNPDLAALITRRHEALRAHVLPAHSGTVEGVHQARVASRRLREVVPVLGEGLDAVRLKPLLSDLRDLTRALGPVRELDVATAMIDALDLPHADAMRLRVVWLARVERQRRAPARALVRALAPGVRNTLDRELAAFAQARAASTDPGWRDVLAQRLTDRARGLCTHIARTGSLYRPEPLHEVRIATKKLRYVMEIAAESGLARLARPLQTLKTAQDALGVLHDVDVLFTSLHAMPTTAPGEDLQHAAAAVVATLEDRSRRLHGRYLRMRAALVRVAEFTIRDVVPKVRPAGRRAAKGTA
jgi:CHAD domain-containing protein